MDGLLSEEPIVVNLSSLFDDNEACETFFNELPGYMLGLFSKNDRVVHIVFPIGYSEVFN